MTRTGAIPTMLPACALLRTSSTTAGSMAPPQRWTSSPSCAPPRGRGRSARCLLEGLREFMPADSEIVETHRPRGADVFHAPWIDGALLRCPCPMVVTLHDLVPLKRRSEYLRTGLRFRLRYLAVQRAVRVIVPTRAVADDALEHLALGPE